MIGADTVVSISPSDNGTDLMVATNWTHVGALAQLATAGVALFALLGAIAQLAQNRRSERARLAHRYLERYGHPDEIPLVAKLHEFVKAEPQDHDARLDTWKAMPVEERLLIIHGLNFWEELGGMYLRKLVDRRIVRDYFGGPALVYWGLSEWFTSYERLKPGNRELMSQFEGMCDHIRGGQAAATRKLTLPYHRRWRGFGRSEQLVRHQRESAAIRDWQRRLVMADPSQQQQMLVELGERLRVRATGP